MNYLYIPAMFLAFTLCACDNACAQARKPALPVDTGVSEVKVLDLLYREPPQTASPSEEKVFGNPYLDPQYPGGFKAMYKFIETNLRMPRAAKRAGVSGKVFVSFVIDTTGAISNATVLKGIGFGCDEEAVRLVESMPNWNPGKAHNKPIRLKYNLPITFGLK